MSKIRNLILACVSSGAFIWFDQYTKFLAVQELTGKDEIYIIPHLLFLKLVYNRGAFLSLGHNLPDFFWFSAFIACPIIFLIFFTIYVINKKLHQGLFVFVWALVVSGAIGNLLDRILQGKVVDFICLGVGWLRTGIFNFADIYITTAFFLLLGFFSSQKKEN